jgi:hypothetical protein
MIRIYRRLPKNSVRQWRGATIHPAIADASPLLPPETVAGPYVLLADAVPVPARSRSHS